MFDDDPKFLELKQIREGEGYDGPLDDDGTRSDPLSLRAQAADALRRTGA